MNVLIERSRWRLVTALVIANMLITGWIATVHLDPFADLATYYQEAQNIAAGKGFSLDTKIVVNARQTDAPFPVGDRFMFPLVAAAALRVFGDSLSVANVVSAVAMCLIALPLYGIGETLFGWRSGLAGVLLFVFSPFYHLIGVGAWTDLLATLWYYGCLFCVVRYVVAEEAASHWPLLAGTSFALAALTREDAIVLALALVVAWWWRGRRTKDALMLAAAPAVAFVGRSLYLWQNFGSPLYNERSYFLLPRWALWYYLGSFTVGDYLEYVGGLGGAVAIRLYNYARFLENLFSDGIFYYTQIGLMPLALIAAVIASVRAARHAKHRRLIFLIIALIGLQFLLGIGYPGYAGNSTEVRHGQLVAPWLLLLAGAGIIWLWGRLGRGRVLAGALAALYAAFAIGQFGMWGNLLVQPAYRGPVVLAAEWAGRSLAKDAVLMTRRAAETHYFSGKTVVVTPSAPLNELIAFAAAHHVTHFLITDVERSGTPNLLQAIKLFPSTFRTVYSTDGAQIVTLTSAASPVSLTIPNDLYAGKAVGLPERLFDWRDLQPGGAGAILDQIMSWGNLLALLTHAAKSPTPQLETVNLRAGDGVLLVSYELANRSLNSGDELQLTLRWRDLAPTKANLTTFVHLLDASGVLRAQKDSPLLGGTRPTYVWEPGETIDDHYGFTIPGDLPAGVYQLEIGLYDPASGARMPLHDSSGNRLADDRLIVGGIRVGE